MAKLSHDLLKEARQNIARLIAMEKCSFTPAAGGAMPPTGATALPADPSMGGGAPPMDPSMMGGAPPMDPAAGGMPPGDPSMMGGGGDPAGGPPILQVNANDLMQMVQMMQGGGSQAAPGGAPNEPGKPKGGKSQALEGKIDALMQKVDMLIGFFAAQSGMNAQQLLNGDKPPQLGSGGTPEGEGESGMIPQVSGGEEEGAAPPPEPAGLQPQASLAKPARQTVKPKPQALRLHELVGNLMR